MQQTGVVGEASKFVGNQQASGAFSAVAGSGIAIRIALDAACNAKRCRDSLGS